MMGISINTILLIILLAPLVGGLIAGLFGKKIGRVGAHWVSILLVALSLGLSVYVAKLVIGDGVSSNVNLFNWAVIGHIQFSVGIMLDRLTVFMMIVVNFVSLLVHIYSVGYMQDDDGYQRFFSYISAFTFSMLSLVMANNFLLLFFGWEAVGLVSYLLIGFWFKKESANYASLKAFIANRVGDLGFLLGIAGVLMYFGALDYTSVFSQVANFASNQPLVHLFGTTYANALTLVCILLFIGAIGKSAQIPLHIWLEGSMEGPTPISALIHAATMVTAGVFMVARLSPMFEYSQVALSMILVIGAITCFFMGLLGIVQNDIKRIIAYSTLSQLGYMMAAQGASAFSFGMFHLMTHAAFKALLFLAAGSVILGMHHQQDIRKMGGLARYMPITYVCMLIGALALAAVPPFGGFFSKDLIIEAVEHTTIPGHSLASLLLVAGAFVTALYTFRLFFVVFHGKSRSENHDHHPHESPLTVTIPLILLAIPSIFAGMLFFMPSLNNFFGSAITVLPQYDVVSSLCAKYHSPWQFLIDAFTTLPFWLSLAGIFVAWYCYVAKPELPGILANKFKWLYRLLIRKYWVDDSYDVVFGGGARLIGNVFWRIGDILIIDRCLVDGTVKIANKLGSALRRMQSGYLYHYALAMIMGLFLLLVWFYIN